MRRVLFDTNIYRDIQRGRIGEDELAKAVARLKGPEVGVVSPLSLIELGSHISVEAPEQFQRFRAAFGAITLLCQDALLDPETFLRREVFRHPVDGHGLKPAETLQICRAIASARDVRELVGGQVINWDGVPSRVSFNAGHLSKFRADYEEQYVADMIEHVVEVAVPDHAARRAAGQMARISDDETRRAVLDVVDSAEFVAMLYRLQATRVGVMLFGGQTEWDEGAMKRMVAFTSAYRWILRQIFEAGYNPGKNKNDLNDIHFLLYLADSHLVLVTHDRGIARKAAAASEQAGRILTFKSWLDS